MTIISTFLRYAEQLGMYSGFGYTPEAINNLHTNIARNRENMAPMTSKFQELAGNDCRVTVGAIARCAGLLCKAIKQKHKGYDKIVDTKLPRMIFEHCILYSRQLSTSTFPRLFHWTTVWVKKITTPARLHKERTSRMAMSFCWRSTRYTINRSLLVPL